jgi:hypothetical protein
MLNPRYQNFTSKLYVKTGYHNSISEPKIRITISLIVSNKSYRKVKATKSGR